MNRRFEHLDESVWKHIFGDNHKPSSIQKLDFSGDDFYLTYLDQPDRGILNTNLNLRNLKDLNVANNRIAIVEGIFTHQCPFANSLRSLNLSNNIIEDAFLELPKLTKLDLSHNNLTQIPILMHLNNLEILKLNHNQITKGWEQLNNCPKLKEIHLNNNKFSMYPSYFKLVVNVLKRCPKLTVFKFAHNPMSNWFPEYELLLKSELPQLKKTDQWEGKKNVQFDFENNFEMYDKLYFDRLKAYKPYMENINRINKEEKVVSEIPTLQQINKLLQTAIENPDKIEEICLNVLTITERINFSDDEESKKLFPASLNNQKTIVEFSQIFTLLVESHENVRELLFKSLTDLSIVPHYNFGIHCIEILRDFMQSSTDMETLGSSAISDLLSQVFKGREYSEPKCQFIIKGLALMRPFPTFARALSSVIVDISRFFQENPKDLNIIKTVSLAVEYPPNAIEFTGQGIPEYIANIMEMQVEGNYNFEDETILYFLNIAGKCAAQVRKAASLFVKKQIHIKFILEKLKTYFRTSNTYEWPLKTAKIVGGIIDFLTGIMILDKEGMNDCIDNYHLTDLLLIPCKETIADPVVFAAALNCLVTIMQLKKEDIQFLKYVTEEMSKGAEILQYLGGINYRKVADAAEKHLYRGELKTVNVPELIFNANQYIHKLFTAILKFIFFFLSNSDNPYCQSINEYLSSRNRDKIIFHVIYIPSNEVKLIAINCLLRIPLENCDVDDVSNILKLFKHFGIFLAGDVAKIVVALLSLLKRFVDDVNGVTGTFIRESFPHQTINAVYELLAKATNERSNNYETEKSKILVCTACVDFLRATSIYPELRKFMRSYTLNRSLKSILKAEEELCFPQSQDITIERCWTGRDVSGLVECFEGVQKLNPRKKTAFRVMNHMADVFESRSILIDSLNTVNLKELCLRESLFFNSIDLNERVNSLDKLESADRNKCIKNFLTNDSIEKILLYMSRLCSPDYEIRLTRDRTNKVNAEYWAGRMKATILKYEEYIEHNKSVPIELKEDLDQFSCPDIPESISNPQKWTIMGKFHSSENINPELDALFMQFHGTFQESTNVWENVAKGIIRPVYIYAALLRLLYCAIMIPKPPEISQTIKKICQRPSIIRRLLALAENIPILDCYTGAKLFTFLRLAFQLESYKSVESMDLIISYNIVAKPLQNILKAFLQTLMYSRVKLLTVYEEVFINETIKLVSVICIQTPLIKFSKTPSIQYHFVQHSLCEFVDIIIIKCIIQSIIYSLALSAGTTRGTYIEHIYAVDMNYREQMRNSAVKFFSALVIHCPMLKYTIYESLYHAEICENIDIRKSFLYEIFDTVQSLHYMNYLQIALSQHHKRAERVILLMPVYLFAMEQDQTSLNTYILILTNYNIYCCEKPSNLRNYKNQSNDENLQDIIITNKLSFNQITRIYRGYPLDQFFIIGWKAENEKERFSVVISHKVEYTTPFISSVSDIIRTNDQNKNFKIESDMFSIMTMKNKVPLEKSLLCSFVVRMINDNPCVFLHVLSEDTLYELSFNWDLWKNVSGVVADTQVVYDYSNLIVDVLEIKKTDSNNLSKLLSMANYASRIYQHQNSFTDNIDVEQYIQQQEDKYLSFKQSSIQTEDKQQNFILKVSTFPIIELSELSFAQGTEPIISFTFKEKKVDSNIEKKKEPKEKTEEEKASSKRYTKLIVTYLDDTVRERWRCTIANILNKSEFAANWRRIWS